MHLLFFSIAWCVCAQCAQLAPSILPGALARGPTLGAWSQLQETTSRPVGRGMDPRPETGEDATGSNMAQTRPVWDWHRTTIGVVPGGQLIGSPMAVPDRERLG